jgi:acyl transferase domain-containing protein
MSDGSIAVIGASCRFPGAEGLEDFWRLLVSGTDAVSEIDERRWSTRLYYHPDRGEPGKSYTWSAGLISGIDRFEPAFFGISPREAAQMDPQQRLLLELAWHAIEDAGIAAGKLAGSGAGVFIGASATDYSDLRLGDPAGADSHFMTGNTLSILANRVSYVLDLHGPSLTIDTACSSSLVALHHACEAIRAEQIGTALVGGVNLLLAPYPFIGFSRASMLSRRGRCFAFDERADGYVRGEGGGVVLLKPLEAALAEGDAIRAVILASGVNSDGRTVGLSLPSEAAQGTLLRRVHAQAGIATDDLAFFEMHGTGTPVGDPVEANAVGRWLARDRSGPLPIGSVKSNIGHLEPASGMAGLIKAALALDHGIVPPSLHCETPSSRIPFEALNLRLVRNAEPIAAPRERRFAGVNSFGFGGTNAHVVLGAPPLPKPAGAAEPLPPLLLSAVTEESLRALAGGWARRLALASAAEAPALLRAAARGREHHPRRLVALGADPPALATALDGFAGNSETEGVVSGTAVREGGLAFVFSGNGAQFPGMGSAALRSSAAFRSAVEEVDALLRRELGWSVAERLEAGAEAAEVARADVAQPLLFAIQVGIVGGLREAGIVATANLGHSVGEIAAAWAAGALTLAEAARVVVARSRQQERTRGIGQMAALALGGDAAREFLADLGSSAEVAAINATHSVTVSGSKKEIARVAAEARGRGLWVRVLDLDFAFHSRAMDPIRQDLLASLAGLESRQAESLLVSTVTGDAIAGRPLDAAHWWRNIRHPVRFAGGVARLIEGGYRVFLEIGPSPILQSYLADGLRAAEADGRVLASLSRNPGEGDPFPEVAARCHVAGHDLSRAAVFDGPTNPRGLPLYPWHRERFWFEQTVEATDPANAPFDHPLLGFRQPGPDACWINHLDRQVLPWIDDHAIEGTPVLPAAAILECALAAARSRWPDAPVLEVLDAEIRRPLPFDKERMRELRTTLGAEDDWQLTSRPRLSREPLTVHAVGRVASGADPRPLLEWARDCAAPRQLDGDAVYRLAHRMGLDYGGRFRTVERIEIAGSDAATVHLGAVPIDRTPESYLLHPALLDGALQGLLGLLADRGREVAGVGLLPWRVGRMRLLAPFGRVPRRARLRLTRIGIRSAAAELALLDENEAIVAELSDCWFRRVELTRRGTAEELALRVEPVPTPLAEPGPAAPLDGIGAILSRLASARRLAAAPEDQALLFDALIGSAAYGSLRRLAGAGTPFTLAELVEAGGIDSGSRGLAECLLELLERLGGAARTGSEWRLEPAEDLPEPADVWRLLLAEEPELVAELALAAGFMKELPGLLTEGLKPPDGRLAAMLEQLLQASPASAAGIDLLCDALERIAEAWPRDRPLRIVEIGAGGGGATRRMLDRLARSGVSFTYTAAGADQDQTARLSFAVEAYAGAGARCWPPGSGADSLNGTRFDVILAVNTCARLPLDQDALADLREILAPGGLFLAVEPEPNALWDAVLGQGADWWRDGASPLRTGEEWQVALSAAGLQSAAAAPIAASPWPQTLLWASAPAPAEPARLAPADSASVLLVSAGTRLGPALQQRLAAAGRDVALVRPDELLYAIDDAATAGEAPGIVLFLAEAPDAADPTRSSAELIATLAGAAATAAERSAALWVVTGGAQQAVAGSGAEGVVGAALWGFARVLVNEMPRLSIRLLDLGGTAADEQAGRLLDELGRPDDETEIVWTEQGRHTLRLRTGLPPRWADPTLMLGLDGGRSGGLDTLGWNVAVPSSPGPGEIAIEVHAAGLNFRDMMWTMGLLPEEALIDGFFGPRLGLECAGIVRSLGPGVTGFAVGDRVMGFAPSSLASQVVTIAEAVAPIPPGIDFAAAATIPVAFVTATYALGHLARLAEGETVLIHAAAGGVGLAAIQFAKRRGATVIATAGSEVKRAFLRLAGADHVLDSRDLGFADGVRALTGGRGVDVVLNSLSAEAMERSIEVLKPFGRFLELGKRDFYENRRIRLRPLRQNISYFAIDVDQLPTRRPELARSLLAEVSAALAEGAIRPLAHRVFSFAELGEAFRLMQSSGHIGKLVLAPRANEGVRLRDPPELTLRRDGTYLVTGGIDGFGWEAARWLASRGAGALALIGRRGLDTPGCAARVAELEAAGVDVRVYSGDVGDRRSLSAVLAAIRAGQPPLRGVVHAAAVIEDGLAAEIDAANIAPILHAKLAGALTLDRLTRDDPIELFLLFSSATTLLGAPGQGAYVAANAAVEALARRRRAEGLPALAIAWGPIADAGYLAERPQTRDALSRRLGAKPLPAAHALGNLPALAATGSAVLGLADTSWTEARRFLPILATPLFSEVRARAAQAATDDSLAERLAGLDAEATLALLKTVVAEEAASILRLPAAGIDPSRPLSEVGMDSLMAVELRLALENRLHIDLPLVSLAEGTSVASIAARLAGALSAQPKDAGVAALAARHEAADPAIIEAAKPVAAE